MVILNVMMAPSQTCTAAAHLQTLEAQPQGRALTALPKQSVCLYVVLCATHKYAPQQQFKRKSEILRIW